MFSFSVVSAAGWRSIPPGRARMIALTQQLNCTMRQFFIFAVLWTALFGPGHVLAACPMASTAPQGAHAPCHSEGDRGTGVRVAHDCCTWVAPSGAGKQIVAQRSHVPADDMAGSGGATHVLSAPWNAPVLTHPPPLISPSRYLGVARPGTDTFLRTARLRL